MIGGPPGVLNNLTLAASKRRRMTLEEENSGDDMEYGEETLRERRIRNKKRRSFYKTVSNADSGSEMDPKSPSAPSSHGEGGMSSGEVSEDEFSESGYITDPTLLSRVLERFVGNVTSNQTAFQHHKHLFQESKVKGAACLPTVLHIKQLAALLTLAVIGRTHSTLTMADMVAWFNSEGLAWKSALAFLPTAYSITTAEKMVFSGQQVMFTTNMMSVLVFRLASFLHQSPEKQISLVSPLTFKPILTRILNDLSLPYVLCKDITNTFKHLHLLSMSATLQPYTPEKTGKLWALNKFPLVSKRILALILLTLKYHCGLDDKYEVYMSHNIKKMATLEVGSDINYFDILSWIRLSKLRLDRLMATNHCVREQYHPLAHVGTPGLVRSALTAKVRVDDKSPSGGENQNPEKKFSDLTKLMSELSVKVKPIENNHLCLQALLDNSQALLCSGATKQVLKKSVEKLLAMAKADMSPCFEKKSSTLRSILHSNHGIGIYSEFRKRTEKKVKVDKNWIVTPGLQGYTCPSRYEKQMKTKFAEMISSGRTMKSKFNVPQPKMSPDKFFRVTNKVYWFAHHYTVEQLTRSGEPNKLDMEFLSDQMLDIIPSNFVWILKYFSCYAHLPPLELLEELNEIENLILMLDPDFFGLPPSIKTKQSLLPWKGGHVQVARRKKKKYSNMTDSSGK